MDGVLADFDKQYETLFGARPKDIVKRSKHFYRNWDAFVFGGNFTKLQLHPGAIQLLEAVDSLKLACETQILSSSGGKRHHECVTIQKLSWLRDKNIGYYANIVPGSSLKAAYAAPWHILIDDTDYVIDSYRKAGGTAIHHTDVNSTISKLHELHLEWQGAQ